MVAPTGARRTKTDHPRLPITPAELADTARECRAAGASALHLHVRDRLGEHSLDPAAYREAMSQIRAAVPDMLIQATTEAAGRFDLTAQLHSVEALRPAWISFSLTELMREGENTATRFTAFARTAGIAIQFILYTPDEVRRFANLRKVLEPETTPRLILVAGRYAGPEDAGPETFEALYAALTATGLDREAIWMTCAFGRGELDCLEKTIARGGHARVGFENAIVDSEGRPARDNTERVALVAEIARRYGRPLADFHYTRRLMGIG